METALRRTGRLITTLALLAACSKPAAPPRSPDVVLIVADDLGWNDVGFNNPEVETPHLDRLAAEGVVLERMYAFPLCTPTRAALFTGRSPFRHGLVYEAMAPHMEYGLPLSETTIAEHFRGAGYDTALIGKWHLGHARRAQTPNARGFDHFYGCLTSAVRYWTKTRKKSVDWQRNGTTVADERYATRLLAAEAEQWITDRPEERPLFLALPFTAPHTPLEAPEETLARFADVADPQRRTYLAMVAEMDDAIGRVLAALEASGRLNDAVIVFVSDNGGNVKQGASNAPFGGGKHDLAEGGIRVPAVLWRPGSLPATRSRQLMAAYDLAPTLLSAAKVPFEAGAFDGGDYWQALTTGQLQSHPPIALGIDLGPDTLYAVVGSQWKLRRYEFGDGSPAVNRLFRIADDPGEARDVAARNAGRVAELNGVLQRWRALYPEDGLRSTDVEPNGWQAPPDWAAAVRD